MRMFFAAFLCFLMSASPALAQSKVLAGVTRERCVVPTITASTYTNVQPVGGLLTFPALFGDLGSGVLQSVTVTSKSVQTAGLNFYPITSNPVASGFLDHTNAAINAADVIRVRPVISMGTPLSGLGTHTVWGAQGIGQAISVGANTTGSPLNPLYGILLPSATTGSFAVGDVQICVQILGDN